MKAVKTIRDPIHGNIGLNGLDVELLDTPYMQRLRNIKQNGLCYLVYPAMNSSRFEHSLGVMHLAGIISGVLDVADNDTQTLKAAALLHDVGHFALSHTLDDITEYWGHSHEENSKRIIQETEISDILAKHGIDKKKVCGLIDGEGKLGKILSSEIDVDKMDYLVRDSYYAGVAYGIIDLDRIINTVELQGRDIVVDRGGLEAVESLLISRNLMYQTVYRHHTKRIVQSMIKHAVFRAAEQGKINYSEFRDMDDIALVNFLRSLDGYPRDIMKRIDERRLFKTLFQDKYSLVVDDMKDKSLTDMIAIENKIAEDWKAEKGDLLIDVPELKLSEFKVLIKQDGGLKRIGEVSGLARALEQVERERPVFCLYTAPEKLKTFGGVEPRTYLKYTD